ncbi:DEAD/DEAH box helicase [Salinarchaeum chitinilyticum]
MLRGRVLEVGDVREVTTQRGTSDLVEVTLRSDEYGPVDVTLWNSWAETAAYLEPGMELGVTDPDWEESPEPDAATSSTDSNPADDPEPTTDGGTATSSATGTVHSASTAPDSLVVVEPDFLVDVTDVREWVQCPRQYYLSKIDDAELAEPLVLGTIVHEVFGDLLRGVDVSTAVEDRIEESGLQIGLLDLDVDAVTDTVTQHAEAIQGWLDQGTLTEGDDWRSEQLLISRRLGLKGRADAVRRGMPVELKTGKNTRSDPRFHDKIQAAMYALVLRERGVPVDTGILLYTKNATLDRAETGGDLSPAKEFSLSDGLLDFALRARNELAAMEHDVDVPTGHEADANCDRCFVQDTCMVVAGRLGQESKAGAIGRQVPDAERDYFDAFYRAIELERRAIHDEYRKLWEQTPAERAEDDRALVDLEFEGKEPLPGGRWRLTARRPSAAVSKLREGDFALASDDDPIEGHAEFCRIQTLDPELVVVTADEPVELTRLDQYPSEITADRLVSALMEGILKGDERRKDVLFERAEPEFDEAILGDESDDAGETFVPNNDAQNAAVQRAVAAEDFSLIHGPPGTGKTYTIARLVRAFVDRGDRVLLSAFTNRAVDNALEALQDQGFDDAIRVGSANGVREDMQDVRLERRGDPDELVEALESAPVVAATAASCGSTIMSEQSFDVAVVDEASQLTEPGTLAAIERADRFVLVGDHEQLPPVVQAESGPQEAPSTPFEVDLSTSLFQRLLETYPEAGVSLEEQYRMAQAIQAFSSREFYDGALRPATPAVAGHALADLDGVETDGLPADVADRVSFLDVGGDDAGRTDAVEADRIADLIDRYLDAGMDPSDVGVIAPYRAQVATIGDRLEDRFGDDERVSENSIAVDTVDRFQGSSKEVIVVSFVATGDLDSPIFEDYRRVNVALTRAKRQLVLVGDAEALATDPVYARMVEWASS